MEKNQQGSTIVNPVKSTAIHREIKQRESEILSSQREMQDIIKKSVQVFRNSCSIDGSTIYEMNRSLKNIQYLQKRITELGGNPKEKSVEESVPTEEEIIGAKIRFKQKLNSIPENYEAEIESSMNAYLQSNYDENYLKKLMAIKNELAVQNKYLRFSIEQILSKDS